MGFSQKCMKIISAAAAAGITAAMLSISAFADAIDTEQWCKWYATLNGEESYAPLNGVSAKNFYAPDKKVIQFDSVSSLAGYMGASGGTAPYCEYNVDSYFAGLDSLYLPKGLSDSLDNVNQIIVCVSSASVYIENNGRTFQLVHYYDKDAGNAQLSAVKQYKKDGTFNVKKVEYSGNTVYCYYIKSADQTCCIWEQDGEIFQLQVSSSAGKSYMKYCAAEKVPLGGETVKSSLLWENGKLYCVYADGSRAAGWQTVDGKRYCFKKDGSAVVKNAAIGGVRYKFASDGECLGVFTGWSTSNGARCYYKNGEKVSGHFQVDGKWYYAKNGVVEED